MIETKQQYTVAELIEWLKTQDQKAIVECIDHEASGNYYCQGGTAGVADWTPELTEYTDFKGNQFVKADSPHFEKSFLVMGRSE